VCTCVCVRVCVCVCVQTEFAIVEFYDESSVTKALTKNGLQGLLSCTHTRTYRASE